MSDIPTRVSQIVVARENSQCRRCGVRGSERHHRKGRRTGGHAVSNIVYLCGDCHRWAHANFEDAVRDGYRIPLSVEFTEKVPCLTYGNQWTILSDDGGVNFVYDVIHDELGPYRGMHAWAWRD